MTDDKQYQVLTDERIYARKTEATLLIALHQLGITKSEYERRKHAGGTRDEDAALEHCFQQVQRHLEKAVEWASAMVAASPALGLSHKPDDWDSKEQE